MNEISITKKMLNVIREQRYADSVRADKDFICEKKERDNFLTKGRILMEEAVDGKKKVLTEDEHTEYFTITKKTPQFGDIRASQEEAIRKAINDNVVMDEDALKYYPNADDMTLDGKIPSLNISFQFRLSDPSGDGVYVWANGLQATDNNMRQIGKVRDAFLNWRQSIVQDADLMEKLKKASKSKED